MSAAAQPFPLSILCDVTVTINPAAAQIPSFNQALICGNSNRIPSTGANSRCRLYLTLAAMIADGFETTDPEYIAASLYFDNGATYLWVGTQDPTAIGTVTIGNDAGTGYVVGDIVGVTQSMAHGGYVRVSSVSGGGVVTGLALIGGQQGTAYSVANNLATTGGTGTGLTVDITAIGETPLEAITACRNAQPAWYLAMSTTAVDADHLALAAYAQTAQPAMQYVYGTQSASALNGTTGNIFSQIKAANYSRAHGAYSTTQSGAAPNNLYIAAAIMGVAMGLNTGAPGSYFTLSGQTLVGIITEPITPAQAEVFGGLPNPGGTGNNGNYYVNWGNAYNQYQQGVNGNGSWFDVILGLDMLAADFQISILNYKQSLPTKTIPLTDAGQAGPINVAQGACQRSAIRGFLNPGGVWDGETVLNLAPGTALPNGYKVQSPSYNSASYTSTMRQNRQASPIIACVILGEAQQSYTIGVNVQQ